MKFPLLQAVDDSNNTHSLPENNICSVSLVKQQSQEKQWTRVKKLPTSVDSGSVCRDDWLTAFHFISRDFFPILTNCSLCWLQGLLVNVIAEDSCSALALTKSIQSIMHSASGPRPARWKAQRYVWLIFNSLSPRGRCDWWIWDLIIVKKTDVYCWLNGKQSVL